MQDNYTPDINPEWMEEGWAGMQQMLDREMPVRRQRPAAWFWWSSAALLIGLGLLIYWPSNTLSEPKILSQLPVPSVESSAITDKPSVASEPFQHALLAQRQQKAGVPLSHSAASVNAATSGTTPVAPYQQTHDATSYPHSETRTADLNTPPAEAKSPKWDPPAPFPEMSFLKSRAVLPIASAGVSAPQLQAPVLPAANNPGSFSFGLLAAGIYSPQHRGPGYEAGLFLNWRPQTSKWYGRLQLSYQQISSNFTLEEMQFAFSSSRPVSAGHNSTLVNFRSVLEVLRYANTSLHAGHQITPRLGIETGLFLRYLADAAMRQTWQATPEPGNSSGTDGSEELFTEFTQSNVVNSTTGLREWNAGITAGISYRINPNLYSTLQFSVPLAPFSTSPRQNQKTTNIALSLLSSF